MGLFYGHNKTFFDQQGKYTRQELDDLINIDGYIPVATADEFDNLRNTITQEMGAGTPWAGDYSTGLDKKYVQIYNLDLSTLADSELDTFSGAYDGNEVSLSNITSLNYGFTASLTGTLINVRIFGDITASTVVVGFAGEMSGTATNCIFYGNLTSTANYAVGAFRNITASAVITNCHYHGNVVGATGDGTAGFSNSNYGEIKGCSTSGSVTISSSRGSCFVFENRNIIRDSHSTADVTGGDFYCASFVGRSFVGSEILRCYSSGAYINTSSLQYNGGICGFNDGNIEDCYSSADITSTGSDGAGCVAYNSATGTVTNSYSVGIISVSGVKGGFCATNLGTITACYYDTTTSGQSDTGKGEPKTTAEMQQGLIPDTTIYVGWSDAIWDAVDASNYPILL